MVLGWKVEALGECQGCGWEELEDDVLCSGLQS